MPFDWSPFLLAAGHEAARLPLGMLLIFGGAKLMSELFERLGQPGIVGEILAGVLLGPSLLGWVQPNEITTALAELGVMFLLFRVGLEVKTSELFAVGRTALVVAVLGVILPFIAGWAICLAWGIRQIEAIFVGAAMVATSVGITAQVLAAKGYLSHRASQTILAAAIIDDVLGLLVLAVVSNLAEGRVDVLGLATTAVMAVSFTLLVVKFGNRALGTVVPQVEQRLKASEAQFNLALVLLFGLSLLAVYAGVAAIIGAFLAGMALGETVNHRVHDLAQGISELLVPFFLVGIGLNLDLAALASPGTLMLAVLITLAAVLSKLVGCGIGALPMGAKDALRVGTGMIPRGEVGMVVAQLGLTLGVVTRPVYGVVVLMAVATTLIAPPLLTRTFADVPAATPEEDFSIV